MLSRNQFFILIAVQVIGFLFLFLSYPKVSESTTNISSNSAILEKKIEHLTEEIENLNLSTNSYSNHESNNTENAMINVMGHTISQTIRKEFAAISNQLNIHPYDSTKSKVIVDNELIEKSLQSSQKVIDNAITKGKWTHDDMAEIQEHLANLSEEQQYEIMDKFHTALNNDQIDIDAGVPSL
jgi:NDP-sugar pyrophosphorylase family protein